MKEALSIIGEVLTLIGALGLFLYGMKLMSEALQKVAGGKMRQTFVTGGVGDFCNITITTLQ